MSATSPAPADVLVVGARFDPLDVERDALAPVGGRVVRASGDDGDAIVASGAAARAVLAGSAPRFSRDVLERLPELRLVVRYGIGVDRIDLEAAAELGIQVCNVPDYCTDEVATQAVTLVLALTRRLSTALERTRSGGWGIAELRPLLAPEATVIAVLGLGRIGRSVAQRLAALGFRLRGFDPYLSPDAATVPGMERAPTVEAALAGADVVTLHLPLSGATRHMLSDPQFASLNEGGYLVNVSRGGLVDEAALVRALDGGRLSGAALDVLEEEPPRAGHPLTGHPKVLVTPHMAWYSVQAERRMRELASQEVARFLAGEPLRHPLVELAVER